MIPDYQTLMLPLLKVTSRGEVRVRDAIDTLANEFGLSQEDRAATLPSGRTKTFDSRVHWAGTYLVQAGLLERPKRGVLRITERGRNVLEVPPDRIDNRYLAKYPEFIAFKERSSQTGDDTDTHDLPPRAEERTPEERIEAAYAEMNAALRSDLLDRVQEGSPEFFEELIVDLMLKMGYGEVGGGQRLGRSNDGGVDGIITEDALGLDVVFLQAKRYQTGNVIGIEKIQAFIGALVGKGANKGVYVTTSHFSSQAIEYATRTPHRLVLIDGDKLTELMVRYKVGVRLVRTVEFMRVDADYFSTDE